MISGMTLKVGTTDVKKGYIGTTLVYQPVDYSTHYLTFVAQENGTFKFNGNSGNNLTYSIDSGSTWTRLTNNTNTPTVQSGNSIMWKATNMPLTQYYGPGSFSSTGNFKVEGNVMSLYYGDNFTGQTSLANKKNAFDMLFYSCSKLTDAGNMVLPATTLSGNCYSSMFNGCTSLTTAPALPATTLVMGCYQNMFQGCTSLTTAPALPATTLADYCYSNMFNGCTSLTKAPELPATTLAAACYSSMFSYCTSLTTAPELPATTLTNSCYYRMFYGCTSLTTAPELPATTLTNSCYYSMFNGCTSLTTAPVLPATTLTQNCYYSMFNGCTSLNYIKCLATDISATDCTTDWVGGVAQSGIFVRPNSMTDWTIGKNGIPEGWADYNEKQEELIGVNLTFIPQEDGTFAYSNTAYYSLDSGSTWTTLSANTSTPTVQSGSSIMWKSNTGGTFTSTGLFKAEGNPMSMFETDFVNDRSMSGKTFRDLFKNCSGLTSADYVILPATTLADYCYYSMFDGCTSLTTAPILPATTLTTYCYGNMFQGCTSLTTAPALPAKTLGQTCYYSMFKDCTSLTSAPSTIPANTIASGACMTMFSGCTSLATAPTLPSKNLIGGCYNGMFKGCTSLTTAPDLPAETVPDYGYIQMFAGCSNLNSIKCLATDILATDCTTDWVSGVSATGTFTKPEAMTGWTTGSNGIPNGWTVNNIPSTKYFTVTALEYTDIGFQNSNYDGIDYSLDNGSTWTTLEPYDFFTLNQGESAMFKKVTKQGDRVGHFDFGWGDRTVVLDGNIMSLVYGDNYASQTSLAGYTDVFYGMFERSDAIADVSNLEMPATTLAENCYRDMFRYLSITETPKLPAFTLVSSCCEEMFAGCSNLNKVTCLATPDSSHTMSWLRDVASSGTFYKASGTTWPSGDSGIPYGWTEQDA